MYIYIYIYHVIKEAYDIMILVVEEQDPTWDLKTTIAVYL